MGCCAGLCAVHVRVYNIVRLMCDVWFDARYAQQLEPDTATNALFVAFMSVSFVWISRGTCAELFGFCDSFPC